MSYTPLRLHARCTSIAPKVDSMPDPVAPSSEMTPEQERAIRLRAALDDGSAEVRVLLREIDALRLASKLQSVKDATL